jgi:hypothetical protein
MGHRSIQFTVSNHRRNLYGHLIREQTSIGSTVYIAKQVRNKMQLPAQLEVMSETEIPPEVVDLNGDPGGSRTPNPQIRSLKSATDYKQDHKVTSADSGKVLQNPQPGRNNRRPK